MSEKVNTQSARIDELLKNCKINETNEDGTMTSASASVTTPSGERFVVTVIKNSETAETSVTMKPVSGKPSAVLSVTKPKNSETGEPQAAASSAAKRPESEEPPAASSSPADIQLNGASGESPTAKSRTYSESSAAASAATNRAPGGPSTSSSVYARAMSGAFGEDEWLSGDDCGVNKIRYKVGDIIQDKLKPFSKSLNIDCRGKRCNNCFGRKTRVLQCKGCNQMHYCSLDCQLEDWHSGHKFECKSETFKAYKGVKGSGDIIMQLFRVWATVKNIRARKKPYLLHDGLVKTYDDLPTNSGKHTLSEELFEEGRKVAADLAKEDPKVTVDLIIHFYEIFQTNGFSIMNEDESVDIGLGIYIEASGFKHSCKPTAFYSIQGTEMQIRAITEIPEGEDPTVSFVCKTSNRADRRKKLLEQFHVDCACTLCLSREDAGIDYELLSVLIMFCETAIENKAPWPKVVTAHLAAAEMLEKIYHKYDDRVTNLYKTVAEVGLEQLNAPEMNMPWFGQPVREQVSTIIVATENRLFYTFGPDHYVYKTFKLKIPEVLKDVYYRNDDPPPE